MFAGPSRTAVALVHHLEVNVPPDDAHLFAYCHKSGHKPLTKSKFISELAKAAHAAGLYSALKSSLKTAKRLQLDRTNTAMDWTCSLGLSVLRLEDRKKAGCGGPVLSVETGLLYPYNYPSKRI